MGTEALAQHHMQVPIILLFDLYQVPFSFGFLREKL
jgi:hypothetical protein